MKGYIKSMQPTKGFGFIRSDESTKDFFFHRSGCQDFDGLVYEYNSGDKILVEFDANENSSKGPRAENVRLI